MIVRGRPGQQVPPPPTQEGTTPTLASSWSPGYPTFSSSEPQPATDASAESRSPVLASSWGWGAGSVSKPAQKGPPAPAACPPPRVSGWQRPHLPATPLPAAAGSALSDAGDSSEGTGVCPAAGRALWPGPGPPVQTAPPPAGRGLGQVPLQPHAQGACTALLPRPLTERGDLAAPGNPRREGARPPRWEPPTCPGLRLSAQVASLLLRGALGHSAGPGGRGR